MTQKNLIISVACILCVGLLGFTLGVNRFLIPSGTLKIAVVDGDRLKKESKPFKAVRDILIAEQSKAHEEIIPIETMLLKEQENIKSVAKKNGEKAKKLKAEFDIRVAELEQKMQKKRAVLDKQANHLSTMIEESVFAIINQIAKEQNISVIFNSTIDEKRSIFFVEQRLDLTDAVINALNKQLNNIKAADFKE